MRNALKELSAEYRRRVRREQEIKEFNERDIIDGHKRELIGKVFPRTKYDFSMLYGMVDRWKKAEMKRIGETYSGAAKLTAYYVLFDKEVQMLRSIESHREQVKKDIRIQKQRDFFKTIGEPIAWNKYYTDWTNKSKDICIEMDTLETQKGHEYHEIYLSISDENADIEDRIQALLNIKLLLHDHNCILANELVGLIDRACELFVRGINTKHLDMLMKRIQGLLLKHIKTPDCSFGVTTRLLRVKEKLMHTDMYYCTRCQKLKPLVEFPIKPKRKLNVCTACSFNDRILEPWIDLSPYHYMLRVIKREERLKQVVSSIVFLLEDKDIQYLVMTIWQGHSAITETTEIHNLRLVRWFQDKDWAPWNCILLTMEEAKAHVRVKNLEEVYSSHFLYRVFNKHELAKLHFRPIVRINNEYQPFSETDSKWKELKRLSKEFVAVNSKTKVFPNCH